MSKPLKTLLCLAVLLALFLVALLSLTRKTASTKSPLRLVLSADMPAGPLIFTQDARAPNVIYTIHQGWNNSIFDIHIFEDLLAPAPGWPTIHFVNNRRIDQSLFTWTPDGTAYNFHVRQQEPVNFELSGRVSTAANQVLIEGKITNHCAYSWTSSIAFMCFRCRLSPDFVDLKGERVFLYDNKTGQAVAVYSLQGRTSQYYNFRVIGRSPPYQNRLMKYNKTLQRRVTMKTTPCITLGGNRDNAMNSIQANVCLSIQPDETTSFTTTLTFEEIVPSSARR